MIHYSRKPWRVMIFSTVANPRFPLVNEVKEILLAAYE
jgi:hypothetical protein